MKRDALLSARTAVMGMVSAIWLLAAGSSYAGRPFATEDAGVLSRGECEWESVAGRAHAKGQPSERSLSTQLGCGVGFKTQLALALGRSSVDGERTHAWSLGGKTGLIDGGEDGTSLTVAYGANAAKGPGDSSYKWQNTAVNLVLTTALNSDWTLHANLGWTRDRPSRRDSTTWAVAGEWTLNEQWAVGAEIYGDDRDRPWTGVGARWNLNKDWSLNASYALNAESPRTQLLTVGFKFAF